MRLYEKIYRILRIHMKRYISDMGSLAFASGISFALLFSILGPIVPMDEYATHAETGFDTHS